MAKIVNLAEYQKTIADRIQQSVSVPVAGTKLGLESGGSKYLVDVSEFSEVIPDLEITPVPFTRDWFLGLTDVRGLIYSVVDMGVFAEGRKLCGERGSYYVISGPQFKIRTALLVHRVLGLRRIDEWRKQREDSASPAWVKGHYVDEREESWQEVSLKQLLEYSEFLQIAQ